jgi:hypothetical protein
MFYTSQNVCNYCMVAEIYYLNYGASLVASGVSSITRQKYLQV